MAIAFQAIDLAATGAGFVAVLALAAAVTMALNFVIAQVLLAMLDGDSIRGACAAARVDRPVLVNIAVVAVIAEIYIELGLTALAFVMVNVIVFTYMARLVATARERTREYANLSWGVLSGLIRTLDERDSRAARHCAAVAAFSRDIARHCGMSKRDQELAHTAGLLHDIGKFALSDRVMERGGELDGVRLARHPTPPRHRCRAAARHRRLRPGRRDRARPPRAPGRPRLPAPPAGRRDPGRSRASSPSPRSTTRSPLRTPIGRR